MKTTLFCLFFALSFSAQALDLLAIGDSQTGATWGRSYFGNYFQKCLKKQQRDFLTLGRGGTQPVHWVSSSAMDSIETIERSPTEPHLNLGKAVPEHKRRLSAMLTHYKPKKVLLFFGDNLLGMSSEEITKQFQASLKVITTAGYKKKDCIFVTPTYEMEIAKKRNVPAKNLSNTMKVTEAIKTAVADKCTIINGLELMGRSELLTPEALLRRIAVEEDKGCFGAAANDNIHYCGQAAQEFANAVCENLPRF